MLKLRVAINEEFDENTSKFITTYVDLELEHSLVSLSKWESKYEKPFLGKDEKTDEETLSYIRLMILTPDYPENILDYFSNQNVADVQEYIAAKQTATWFNEPKNQPPSRETITSELVYYWMTSLQIPWEAERWHLSRLFTLIKIFNAKNTKQPKRSQSQIAADRRALNEQRRQAAKSKG